MKSFNRLQRLFTKEIQTKFVWINSGVRENGLEMAEFQDLIGRLQRPESLTKRDINKVSLTFSDTDKLEHHYPLTRLVEYYLGQVDFKDKTVSITNAQTAEKLVQLLPLMHDNQLLSALDPTIKARLEMAVATVSDKTESELIPENGFTVQHLAALSPDELKWLFTAFQTKPELGNNFYTVLLEHFDALKNKSESDLTVSEMSFLVFLHEYLEPEVQAGRKMFGSLDSLDRKVKQVLYEVGTKLQAGTINPNYVTLLEPLLENLETVSQLGEGLNVNRIKQLHRFLTNTKSLSRLSNQVQQKIALQPDDVVAVYELSNLNTNEPNPFVFESLNDWKTLSHEQKNEAFKNAGIVPEKVGELQQKLEALWNFKEEQNDFETSRKTKAEYDTLGDQRASYLTNLQKRIANTINPNSKDSTKVDISELVGVKVLDIATIEAAPNLFDAAHKYLDKFYKKKELDAKAEIQKGFPSLTPYFETSTNLANQKQTAKSLYDSFESGFRTRNKGQQLSALDWQVVQFLLENGYRQAIPLETGTQQSLNVLNTTNVERLAWVKDKLQDDIRGDIGTIINRNEGVEASDLDVIADKVLNRLEGPNGEVLFEGAVAKNANYFKSMVTQQMFLLAKQKLRVTDLTEPERRAWTTAYNLSARDLGILFHPGYEKQMAHMDKEINQFKEDTAFKPEKIRAQLREAYGTTPMLRGWEFVKEFLPELITQHTRQEDLEHLGKQIEDAIGRNGKIDQSISAVFHGRSDLVDKVNQNFIPNRELVNFFNAHVNTNELRLSAFLDELDANVFQRHPENKNLVTQINQHNARPHFDPAFNLLRRHATVNVGDNLHAQFDLLRGSLDRSLVQRLDYDQTVDEAYRFNQQGDEDNLSAQQTVLVAEVSKSNAIEITNETENVAQQIELFSESLHSGKTRLSLSCYIDNLETQSLSKWRNRHEEMKKLIRKSLEDQGLTNEKINTFLREQVENPFNDKMQALRHKLTNGRQHLQTLNQYLEQNYARSRQGEIINPAEEKAAIKAVEDFFSLMPSAFRSLNSTVDFVSGSVARPHKIGLQDRVNQIAIADDYLAEADRERAARDFHKTYKDYKSRFDAFKKNLEKIKEKAEADRDKYSEKDFANLYGNSPDHIIHDLLEKQLGDLETEFNSKFQPYASSNYITNWQNRLLNRETRGDALAEIKRWDDLKQPMEQMEALNGRSDAWFEELEKNEETLLKEAGRGLKKLFGRDVQWISPMAVIYMFTKLGENMNRWAERNKEAQGAMLGMQLFGEDSAMGAEFRRIMIEEESKRVEEQKNKIKSKDPWQLEQELSAVKGRGNRDIFRAILDLQSEAGLFRLDSWPMLQALNRCQKGVVFTEGDLELYTENPIALQDKVRKAMDNIWPYDNPFNGWERAIAGKLESQISERKQKSRDMLDNQIGYVKERLWGMMRAWKTGENLEDNDPRQFLSLLDEAIAAGKMNGFGGGGDMRFYFLMMAFTTKNPQGTPLLSYRDISGRFVEKYNQQMPVLEYFRNRDEEYRLKGMVVNEDTPGAEKRQWNQSDVDAWAAFLQEGINPEGSFAENASKIGKKSEEFVTHFMMSDASVLTYRWSVTALNQTGGSMDSGDANIGLAITDFPSIRPLLEFDPNRTNKVDPNAWAHALGAFHGRFGPDAINQLDFYKSQFGDGPHYQKHRERILKQAARNLQAYFGLGQYLSGNMWATSSNGNTTMDKVRWSQNNNMEHFRKTNRIVGKVLGQNISDFHAISDYKTGDKLATGGASNATTAMKDASSIQNDHQIIASDTGIFTAPNKLDMIEQVFREEYGL